MLVIFNSVLVIFNSVDLKIAYCNVSIWWPTTDILSYWNKE